MRRFYDFKLATVYEVRRVNLQMKPDEWMFLCNVVK